MLFSGKIYTACTNFTWPPVVTVATNLNSDQESTMTAMFEFMISPDHFLSDWVDLKYNSIFGDLCWSCAFWDRSLSCNLSLDYFMMLLLVESHSLPSAEKMCCFYDTLLCGDLKHLSTWMSCHRCHKNERHQWYDLLPHDFAYVCNNLLFHKHCMWPNIRFCLQRCHF